MIVAAYNEENNVGNCLDCLVKQTYKNIEILIIDDGSVDYTASIINTYIEKYPNIQYFYQENSGALAARRNGLNRAKGDFITFLDCDDELHLDAIETAMKEFGQPEIDIVLFDLHTAIDATNTKFKSFEYFTESKLITGQDAFINCIGKWGIHGSGIYKKDIFLKASNRYLEVNKKNFTNNDEVVTKLSFYYSNKIKISDAIYLYKFNPNSTTKKINENYVYILENALIFENICKKEGISFDYGCVLFEEIRFVYNIFKEWRKKLKNKKVWTSVLKKSLNSILFSYGLKGFSFKNKLRFCRMYVYVKIVEFYEK